MTDNKKIQGYFYRFQQRKNHARILKSGFGFISAKNKKQLVKKLRNRNITPKKDRIFVQPIPEKIPISTVIRSEEEELT